MVDDKTTEITDKNSPENVRHELFHAPERLVDEIARRMAQAESRGVWLGLLAPSGAPVVPLYRNYLGPPLLNVGPHDDRPALKKIDRDRAHSAYVRDIGTFTTRDLTTQLGLHVYEWLEDSGMRTARRYINDGRKLLSKLGAWPWTLAGTDGTLRDNWHLDRDHAVRLADWHYNATVGAFMSTLGAARLASGAEFHDDLWRRALRAANTAYWPPTLPRVPDRK